MARPPLPLGSWGEIRTYYHTDGAWHSAKNGVPQGVKPDGWRAVANFRDYDGRTRPVERSGATEAKATKNLRDALSKRAGIASKGLTASSRIAEGIPLYLDWVKQHKVDTTYDRYEGRIRLYVRPYLGGLLYRECTAGRIDRTLDTIRADHPEIAAETLRGIRTVIGGILQVGVKHDVIAINPIHSISDIEGGPKRKAHAYEPERLLDFLRKLDSDKVSRKADLPDLIRFLFGTGARFGEALAVRWCDCNLTDEPVWVMEPGSGERMKVPPRSVWLNGNIVAVKGKGLVRHSGKSFRSRGIVGLPDFLYTMLLVRAPAMATVGAGAIEPVFPSGTLGWRHPSNVQRSVRRLRERIGYPDFVTHVGRKTVATVLAESGQTSRQIADQLRHSSIQTTEQHYIERGLANPAAAAVLDAAHRPAS